MLATRDPRMANPNDYRQRVPDLRKRLDTIVRDDPKRPPAKGRKHIDTTGNRSRAGAWRNDEARLMAYALRRYLSVARVCAVLQLVRDAPGRMLPNPTVDSSGAWWQAFGGNDHDNACHTCPCLLTFDGLLPTQLTTNPGLRRHLVNEFADCMLMPKSINAMDKLVDERLGADAFVAAADRVLNRAKATWEDGLDTFDGQMADIYENARQVLFTRHDPHALPRPPEQEAALETLCTYYEGMAAGRANRKPVQNFLREVRLEACLP
jgi:hypothetical protein